MICTHSYLYIDIIYHHLSHIPSIAPQAGATPVFTAGLAMLVLKLPRIHRGTERGAAQEWRGSPGSAGAMAVAGFLLEVLMKEIWKTDVSTMYHMYHYVFIRNRF
jgi:hypothetical protein